MIQEPGKLQFSAPESPGDVALQVAPMIDIVFLLICFYLFVGQMVSSTHDSAVNLASMTNQIAAAEMPAELVVNLRQDGKVTVEGREVSPGSLSALLREQVSLASGNKQVLRVVVRADKRQRYASLDDVLKTCRDCGIDAVVFRTIEEAGR